MRRSGDRSRRSATGASLGRRLELRKGAAALPTSSDERCSGRIDEADGSRDALRSPPSVVVRDGRSTSRPPRLVDRGCPTFPPDARPANPPDAAAAREPLTPAGGSMVVDERRAGLIGYSSFSPTTPLKSEGVGYIDARVARIARGLPVRSPAPTTATTPRRAWLEVTTVVAEVARPARADVVPPDPSTPRTPDPPGGLGEGMAMARAGGTPSCRTPKLGIAPAPRPPTPPAPWPRPPNRVSVLDNVPSPGPPRTPVVASACTDSRTGGRDGLE